MNNPPQKLTGSDKLAVWLNQLREFAISSRVISAYNAMLEGGTDGIRLKAIPGSGGTSTPSTLDAFTLTDIKGDYLVCTPRGGGAVVNVAKSPCLWQSVTSAVIEGVTVTYSVTAYVANVGRYVRRDATIQGTTIKEEVTPPYIVGQPIYAMKVTGGTGAVAPTGTTVDYVSMADPRAWATRADQST